MAAAVVAVAIGLAAGSDHSTTSFQAALAPTDLAPGADGGAGLRDCGA
jgi:hypothetical protein